MGGGIDQAGFPVPCGRRIIAAGNAAFAAGPEPKGGGGREWSRLGVALYSRVLPRNWGSRTFTKGHCWTALLAKHRVRAGARLASTRGIV